MAWGSSDGNKGCLEEKSRPADAFDAGCDGAWIGGHPMATRAA